MISSAVYGEGEIRGERGIRKEAKNKKKISLDTFNARYSSYVPMERAGRQMDNWSQGPREVSLCVITRTWCIKP